jgi:hypothetical protein
VNVLHTTGFGFGVGAGAVVGIGGVAVGVGLGVAVGVGVGDATRAAALGDAVATLAFGSGVFGGGVALQAPMTTAATSATGASIDRRAGMQHPPR